MIKTIHSRQSECVRETLVALRLKAGLTQRQLAATLGRERSLVGRLELGERRLDMVEFFWVCRACMANPITESAKLMRQLEAIQSKEMSANPPKARMPRRSDNRPGTN